jgi:hypothetical protein
MGLAQKRISQEFQEKMFEKWQKRIDKAAGFEVYVEVKWDTLLDETLDDKKTYFENYEAVYFQPLVEAIENVCEDDIGRAALKRKLKKVIVDGSEGYEPKDSTFENGILTIRHKFNVSVKKVKERSKEWTKTLSEEL